MKIIDLLNKIANGEEVPTSIIYQGHYYYNVGNEEQAYYENTELDDNLFLYAVYNESHLNDEVEIIEEKEEKKIPEKLIPTSLRGIDNLDEKIDVAHIDTVSVIETLNQVIDYLKSKGDE